MSEEKESRKLGVVGKAGPSLPAKFIVKSYLLRRLVAAVSFTLCSYTLYKRFSKSRKDQNKRVLVPSKLPPTASSTRDQVCKSPRIWETSYSNQHTQQVKVAGSQAWLGIWVWSQGPETEGESRFPQVVLWPWQACRGRCEPSLPAPGTYMCTYLQNKYVTKVKEHIHLNLQS